MIIQVKTLDEAHKLLPNASWWIKADGCDVITSLGRREWNGDIDIGDGTCQRVHQDYLNRLGDMARLKADVFDSSIKQDIIHLLNKVLTQLKE